MLKKSIIEFIGTFFLVLTIGMVAVYPPTAGAVAPLAIGVVLVSMVYLGGYISKAHYNPAVTIGFITAKAMPKSEVLPYIASQLLAALLASFCAGYLSNGAMILPTTLDVPKALLAELIFTFGLVTVILHVAIAKKLADNSFYGIAIGFFVMAGAFAVGPVSSAAFNPAVAFGLCIMGHIAWSQLWVYLLANTLGGVLAALVFVKCVPADRS